MGATSGVVVRLGSMLGDHSQSILQALCLGITPGWVHGIPGIKPGLALCKAKTLPTVLSL